MTFVAALQAYPVLFYSLVIVCGLAVGSFLNVVIYRLPKMMFADWREQCCELLELEPQDKSETDRFSLSSPASSCPACGHKIRVYENIPVLSYLFLKGRCSACKTTISLRYPVIELLTGVLTFVVAHKFGVSIQTLLALLLTWSLISLTLIDYDHQILPDNITLPFLWLGIIANMFGFFTDIYSSLFGAIFGYLSFWSVYILFKLVTGKEGMGHGDFKLMAMLGAWLGWQQLPVIIILSSVVGAIVGIGMMLIKSLDRSTPIPFGPYISVAGWIALIWGPVITRQYLHWV